MIVTAIGSEVPYYLNWERNSITRSDGNWSEDSFKPGDSIIIEGTEHNDGIYRIEFISEDGKVLVIDIATPLKDEGIDSDNDVSIGLVEVMSDYGNLKFEHTKQMAKI